MAQRDIPRKIPRKDAGNNRIADEAADPGSHVTVDQRACCPTAAQGERNRSAKFPLFRLFLSWLANFSLA